MKRRNTLLEAYQRTAVKKMNKGGFTKPFSESTAAGIQGGGMILDGAIDALDTPDKFGVRTTGGAAASGAVKGAMAGASLGPIGMAAGAVIGGAASMMANKKAQEAKQASLVASSMEDGKTRDRMVATRLANNSDLQYGNSDAQMFKFGGTVMGKPSGKFNLSMNMPKSVNLMPDLLPTVAISPGKMISRAEGGGGKVPEVVKPVNNETNSGDRQFWNGFVDHLGKKGLKGSTELDKRDTNLSRKSFDEYSKGQYNYDEFIPKIQGSISKYRNTAIEQVKAGTIKWEGYKNDNNFDGFMPGLSEQDGWAGSKTTTYKFPNEKIVGTSKSNTIYPKMAKGGVIPTSSTTSQVVGPSHEEGGVKVPSEGVELEGGESVAGDFVFSKELGFADIHNDLGKAMGKNERRPFTALNKNTAEAMKRKEGFLKIYQEQFKKDKGLPNEIDNTISGVKQQQGAGMVVMRNGGVKPVRRKINGAWTNISQEESDKIDSTAKESYNRKLNSGKLVYDSMKDDPFNDKANLLSKVDKFLFSGNTITGNTGSVTGSWDAPVAVKKAGVTKPISAVKPLNNTAVGNVKIKENGIWKTVTKAEGNAFSKKQTEAWKTKQAKEKLIPSKSGSNMNVDAWNNSKAKGILDWASEKVTGSPTAPAKYEAAPKSTLSSGYRQATSNSTPTISPVLPTVAPKINNKAKPIVVTGLSEQEKTAKIPYRDKKVIAATKGVGVTHRTIGTLPKVDFDAQLANMRDPTELKGLPPIPGTTAADKQSTASIEKTVGVEETGSKKSLGSIIQDIAPFASNIANSFRKLPMPNRSKADDEINAELINLDADRAEATRQRRGANKTAEQNLNSGNSLAATRAANLVGQMREANNINQTESNANAQIKNQAAQVNAQIKRGNNMKTDFYNNQLVERQIKQQQLGAENLADVGNKVQLIARDKKMADLDDDKMILTMAQDDTGASFRAGDAVLKRRLSPAAYKQVSQLATKMEAANEEDRKLMRSQMANYLSMNRLSTNTLLADQKAEKANADEEIKRKKAGY